MRGVPTTPVCVLSITDTFRHHEEYRLIYCHGGADPDDQEVIGIKPTLTTSLALMGDDFKQAAAQRGVLTACVYQMKFEGHIRKEEEEEEEEEDL